MSSEETRPFERVARYYEVLANARKRLERESPLLSEVFERAPGERVLDLACGTGMHAFWFAQQGASVTATDLSEGMIAYARSHRAHERVDYRAGDMRTPPAGTWDLAICMGNSLSLLIAEADLRRVFSRVGERLSRSGLFLFQVLNYGRPDARQPRHRVEDALLPEGKLVAVKNLVPVGNYTLLALNFFVEEEQGRFQSAVDTAVLRHWSQDELIALARESALETEGLYGGFRGEPFETSVSPDLIVLLRKV